MIAERGTLYFCVADSFHIETVTAYPADYDECCDVAKKELADKVVIPFNTHEGSGESGTYSAIGNYLPKAQKLSVWRYRAKQHRSSTLIHRSLSVNGLMVWDSEMKMMI